MLKASQLFRQHIACLPCLCDEPIYAQNPRQGKKIVQQFRGISDCPIDDSIYASFLIDSTEDATTTAK